MISLLTAFLGTILTFTGAYLIDKSKSFPVSRKIAYFLSITPLAIPGTVIGLSFIYSAMYIGIMLVVDLLYGIIDPRIRLAKGDD